MRYCTTNYFERRQDHFVCANYRSNTGSCSAHFIRAVVLEELVWMHMKEVISYVTHYEAHFRSVMEERLKLATSEAIKVGRKKLAKAEKRLDELDRLFIRLYEDNVGGKVSDERFAMMSKTYEDEQAALKDEVQALRREIEMQERQTDDLEQFIQVYGTGRADPLCAAGADKGHLHRGPGQVQRQTAAGHPYCL